MIFDTLEFSKMFSMLRDILKRHLHDSEHDVQTNTNFYSYPRLSLFTTIHEDPILNLININHKRTEPALYFIGPYNALLWGEWDAEHETTLPANLHDTTLQLEPQNETKIAFVTPEEWVQPLLDWEVHTIRGVQYQMFVTIAGTLNIPISLAIILLRERTLQIKQEKELGALECVYLAYREVVSIFDQFPADEVALGLNPDPEITKLTPELVLKYIAQLNFEGDSQNLIPRLLSQIRNKENPQLIDALIWFHTVMAGALIIDGGRFRRKEFFLNAIREIDLAMILDPLSAKLKSQRQKVSEFMMRI